MPESTAVVEPSTEVQPQGQPEANATATPKVTEPQKPLSFEEKWQKGLKDLEDKDKPKEEVTAPEPEATTEETAPEEDGEFVDKVKYGDKEMPLVDLFEQAEFEVPFRGEMRSLEGGKLIELASIGLGAAQTNREAKEVVAETQRLISDLETSKTKEVTEGVTKGVAQELERLLDMALSGTNPGTNRAFGSQQEKQETVNLLTGMKQASKTSSPNEPAISVDEIERRVEAKLEAKMKAQQSEAQQQRIVQEITNAAQSGLQKATEPLMRNFLQEDGKTLNKRLFGAFQRDVQAEADTQWVRAGKPLDTSKINDFIQKASLNVLKEYRGSLRSVEEKPKEKAQAPVVKPSSGAPTPINAQGKKLPMKALQDLRWEQAMKAQAGKGR